MIFVNTKDNTKFVGECEDCEAIDEIFHYYFMDCGQSCVLYAGEYIHTKSCNETWNRIMIKREKHQKKAKHIPTITLPEK